MNNQIYKLIWRFIAIVCMLAWGMVLIQDIHLHVNGYQFPNGEIFTPFMGILFCSVTILILGVLIAFPLRFEFYAVLCCFRGIENLIDGGASSGFLMYLLGIAFAFRVGFFKKKRIIKIIICVLFPVFALVSQVRFSIEQTISSTLSVFAVALIFGLTYFLFLPDIRRLLKKTTVNTSVLYLSAEQFSERDLRCLKKVQNGEKYESIAKEEDIGLSTLKNKMKLIYKSLNVYDKTTFLSTYAGYTIALKSSSSISSDDIFSEQIEEEDEDDE